MANVNFNGQSASGGATSLNQLTDVNITTPLDGQIFKYNGTSSKWENDNPPAIPDSADDISYDNTTSDLTANNVQEALDEIDGNVDTLSGKVYKTDDSTETTIASDDLLPIYDTSATAAKKITVANVVKATVSNPNLFDNPWFTVNQRGLSSYSAVNTYSLDRWRINNNDLTVAVIDDGVQLTHSNDTNPSGLCQYFETDRLGKIIGKTVTLSIMTTDGNIYSGSAIIPTFTSSINRIIYFPIANSGFDVALSVRQSNNFVIISSTTANATVSIKAVKLEIGSQSTLAMDTAPNYATELLKCQRYFQRYNIADTVAWGCGHIYGSYAMVCRPLCCPMRTNPVLTVNGGLSACRLLVNGQGKVVIGLSIGRTGFTTNSVTMVVNTASSIGLDSYVAAVTLKPETDSTLSIDLSADL